MRSETEMIDLILGIAKADDRVRAVIMNGSRTNPRAPKDCFQDYDIVYIVRDLPSFTRDHAWIDIFGERIILQMPEAMTLLPPCGNGSFNYQMLFADGNRIDLTLIPLEKWRELWEDDSLTTILLDKDGILPRLEPADDRGYHTAPPTAKLYADCCNEFWWVLQNAAKGIWRDELPYAMRMHGYARDMLDQMAAWQIGLAHDYHVSPGKCGKYFKRYLPARLWESYRRTYAGGDYTDIWRSIFEMCALFRELALQISARFGFAYPCEDDRKMTAYLRHVRDLPGDAREVY